jgi:peptidoglycan/xylan/chitin deacetylase (PgdA/CDA1 family)
MILSRLKTSFYAVAVRSGLSWHLAHRQRCARVLMYHSVHTSSLSPQVFEDQLRHLQRYFEPVTLTELLTRCRNDALEGREVVITFDDGLHNHHAVVYPILERTRVPATFFICPDLMDRGAWIWSMALRYRLRTLDTSTRRSITGSFGYPQGDTESIIQWAKTLAIEPRQALEKSVEEHTPQFQATPEQQQICIPLTWEEVAQLDPRWVSIGSHTCTHPILTTISDAHLLDEIQRSRKVLEERLHRPVPHFCYPNGDNDPKVAALVAQHYEAAVTTQEGLVHACTDLHRISRIPASDDLPLFAWRMHRPTA